MSLFVNLRTQVSQIPVAVTQLELTELHNREDVLNTVRSMNELGYPNDQLIIYEVGKGDAIPGYSVDEFLAVK